jgi:disulfide bond formation protein DsbB
MKRSKWITGVLLFIVSAGVAIALSHFMFASPPPQPGLAHGSSPASPVQLPTDYKQQFVHYATVDCPASGSVRQMYIDRPSLESLRTNDTVPSGAVIVMETRSAERDGDRLVPTRLNNLFVREKRQGWQVLGSGEWQSAWYSPDGDLVSNNQTSCVACHLQVRDRDYLFTMPALLTAARTGQTQRQVTEFGTSVCR